MIGIGDNGELGSLLAGPTREGELWRPAEEAAEAGTVQCVACAHMCRIPDGRHGVCHMRVNRGGGLQVPHGYVSSVACDPIEKKPFFHFMAGRDALSFGMLGCNFHCPFCQNWSTSQTLRDPQAIASTQKIGAERLVQLARRYGAPVVSSTYNEPLITSEWAVDIFRLAKEQGMLTCYVSNGFASRQVLDYLAPWLDAMNVDLKCFTDKGYAWLGGRLQPVLETIQALRSMGKWVEVITLLVPGFNDSDAEITRIADFLISVSPDIPWHVTAYHADYRMQSAPSRTSTARLAAAIEIGKRRGLRYVYAGNVHGLPEYENTKCHDCGRLLVVRRGFVTSRNDIVDSRCPDCGTRIPGVWDVPQG